MSSAVRVLALLVVLALVTLSGCGGNGPPKSPQVDSRVKAPDKAQEKAPEKVLAKGTCWDDAHLPDALGEPAFADWVKAYAGGDPALGKYMRDDAAFSNRTDCAAPHSLELYNVVRLAPSLDAAVKKYADLLDHKSALYRKISAQVSSRCLAASPYGRAQRKAGGIDVELSPWLGAAAGLHLAWDPFPADLWEKGQRRFVCTFQQDKPATLGFADVTTAKVPIAARVCLNTPRKYRSCKGEHQAEVIGELTLNKAIAKGQVAGRKAISKGPDGDFVVLSDPQYAKLDKVCQTFLDLVSDVGGGVAARAYPGEVSQWPTKEGDYVASCFALKPFEPPPMITGTVFDRG